MRVTCFAKINLYLNVAGKRVDGFHEIESLFQTISLFDTLTITPADMFELTLNSQSAGLANSKLLQKNNLLEKVFDYFFTQFKIKPLKVDLNKQIPLGAGLGGGSSDAAGFMHALNKINHLSLSPQRLEKIAALFGSDVPFFIRGGIAQVSGRGEIIKQLPLFPKLHIILIYPQIHISTKEAYEEHVVRNNKIDFNHVVRQYADFPINANDSEMKKYVDKIAKFSYNGFEKKTLTKYQEVFSAYSDLKKYSDYVLLSGSGASVFAVFSKEKILDNVSRELKHKHKHVYCLHTNDKGSILHKEEKN